MKKFLLSSGAVTIDVIELIMQYIEGWNNKVNIYFEMSHPKLKKYWAAYKNKQKIATTYTWERY
jgi:hypothetical protein